jgi:hypothetical protein
VPKGAYFISDNKFYQCTAAAGIAMKGTRAYIVVENTSGASSAKAFTISIDGEPTSVDKIADGENLLPNDVYSIDGRMVRKNATTMEGLPKGLYIRGGKKVVVK